MLLLSIALAGPVEEATAALHAQPPHRAHYRKVSTGNPVLEVTYNSPREGTLKAISPEGIFQVSVDATHMRLALDERCASIDARALFTEARQAALDLNPPEGPPGGQLLYRVKPDQNIDVSTSFMPASNPPLFSWLDDLGRGDVTVATDDQGWTATAPTGSWTVRRSDGRLVRMTVGEDALELVPSGADESAALAPASAVCPATNDDGLRQSLEGQMRLYSALNPLSSLVSAWGSLPAERRGEATTRQTTWWRATYQVLLPVWAEQLRGGPWTPALVADMSDPAAYGTFHGQLPEEQRAHGVALWKQHWFERVGQEMLSGFVGDLHGQVLGGLREAGAPVTEANVEAIVSGPMRQAALAEAEATLQSVLVPVVEEGGRRLEQMLAE